MCSATVSRDLEQVGRAEAGLPQGRALVPQRLQGALTTMMGRDIDYILATHHALELVEILLYKVKRGPTCPFLDFVLVSGAQGVG